MSTATHTETLEARIDATASEQIELRAQRQQLQTQIGAAVADGVDETADKLQLNRETVDRKLERLAIQHDALTEQRNEAALKDAEASMASIGDRLPDAAASYREALKRYHKAVQHLQGAATAVLDERKRLTGLASQAGRLAALYDVEAPDMPTVPHFSLQDVKDALAAIREHSDRGSDTPDQAYLKSYRRTQHYG